MQVNDVNYVFLILQLLNLLILALTLGLTPFALWRLYHSDIQPANNYLVWGLVIIFVPVLGALFFLYWERRNRPQQSPA